MALSLLPGWRVQAGEGKSLRGGRAGAVRCPTGKKTKELYPKEMRVVKYYDKETDRTFEFLTNDLKRSAEEVALIYKKWWEVELFFKWIK